MQTEDVRPRAMGITLRATLLSWLVAIATLLTFVVANIPQHKRQERVFEENLAYRAGGISSLLVGTTYDAFLHGDYPTAVSICQDGIRSDRSLEYVALVRKDGVSFTIYRHGWLYGTNQAREWPADKRDPFFLIGDGRSFTDGGRSSHAAHRVFQYSRRMDPTNIYGGWLHLGISLESHDEEVAAVYKTTGLLAGVWCLLSLGAAWLYAKRLVRPILDLRGVVRRIDSGDLEARAVIERRDELGALAASVNRMTETLFVRDKIMQSVRFAAEEFMRASKWDRVVQEVLGRIGEATAASRVYVAENVAAENGQVCSSRRFEWVAAGIQPQMNNPVLRKFSWIQTGLGRWLDQLQRLDCVASSSGDWTDQERAVFEPQGLRSLLLIPVCVENRLWGYLGVDACDHHRQWTEAERDSLRAAA